jgi:crotonobetaine/carnitine-CoA ligase
VRVRTVPQFLSDAVERYPHKPFLFWEEEAYTYGAFQENVLKAAWTLRELGMVRGDRLAMVMPNSDLFLFYWLGALALGVIAAPLNVGLTAPEIAQLLGHCEPKVTLVSPRLVSVVEEAVRLASLRTRLLCAGGPSGAVDVEAIRASMPGSPPEASVSSEDVAVLIYTSGTTGRPKAVMQPHRTYVLTGEAVPHWLGLSQEDRLLTCLPLFHINAQAYSTMGALGAGASLALLERFSASRFWDQVRRYRATVFNAIGTMLLIMYRQPEGPHDASNPVRLCYSALALPRDITEALERRFGMRIVVGYGLSESTFGTIEPLSGPRKWGTIGLPRQHPDPSIRNEVRIVDDYGNDLPPGVYGEILLRNPVTMIGYYRDPQQTAQVLRDGWLYTGDLAYRDDDGYLYFVARKKEIIRRRGENISPTEIEMVISSHPKVQDVAVIGVPSELGEEEVKAYIAPVPGAELVPEEIVQWCAGRLAPFKIPRYIEIRTDLPRTPTQRIAKHLLKGERQDLTAGCYDRLAAEREGRT